MKRMIYLFFACVMTMVLMSCGSIGTANAPHSAGYLPTRLEEISEGGVVPEGYESKTDMSAGNYFMESIWGTWVPISESLSEKTFTTKDRTYIDEETGEEREPKSIELKIFPYELNFCPSWVSASPWGGISSYNSKIHSASWNMNEEDTDFEDTIIGAVLRNQGLGQGYVKYNYNNLSES